MLSLILLFALIDTSKADVSGLNLCRHINGDLRPIEKLVCESSAALIESMNPTLKIPQCSEKQGPKLISGEKPISAIFVSCTKNTYNTCYNIASAVMKNQPGVTVNVLVTNADVSNINVYEKLVTLNDSAKNFKTPFNIIPINKSAGRSIGYARDPGLFVGGDKTSFVGLPYSQQEIPGNMIMKEAMDWCGIESTDTYKDLASFDTAYNSLVIKPGLSKQEEEVQRELSGIKAVSKFDSVNATMGGNFLALPNGSIITGSTKFFTTDDKVVEYFSKTHKVLKIKIPDLSVGHIDEVINIVPSSGGCGYTILQASPNEALNYISNLENKDKPFLRFFDVNSHDIVSDEKSKIQKIAREATKEMYEFKQANPGVALPEALAEKVRVAEHDLSVITGMNIRTPKQILKDPKLIAHWSKLESDSNKVVEEILAELSSTKSCIPEVVKLPVFWDITMPSPVVPNPVNGLAVNGSYFRSESIKNQSVDVKDVSRFDHLDNFIDAKLQKLFPKGILKVDTRQLDEGSGNFHCATTNIYLPCKE